MKTLAALVLATVIASPVLAQEADRNALPSEIGPQAATSVRHPTQHPSVRNAFASAVQTPATLGSTDPDSFIRSQLSRDALSD
jgi:hypothetical protein